MTETPRSKPNRSRRGRGEHSIYQRSSDGRWIAEVRDGQLPSGKPRIKYLTAKTKTEVQRKLREEVKRIAQGRPDTERAMTLGAYLNHWLQNVVKARNRATTYESYSTLCRVHIIPRIGHRKLSELTPQDVQEMLADMVTNLPPGAKKGAKVASPTTAKNARGVLRKALNDAMRGDLVWRNVVTLTDMPAQRTFHPRPLKEVELEKYLAACKGHRLEALWILLPAMGLREGEAFGLKWDDVDLEAGILRVRQQIQRVGNPKRPQFVEPKTERSRRPVPVPPEVIEALEAHRERQADERMLAGSRWGNSPKAPGDWERLVFCSTIGTPLDPANVLKEFRGILKEAGLNTTIRVHDLRHTCATMLARLGVPPRDAQDIMRHAQITTTLGVYTSVEADSLRSASDRLGSLFADKKEQT
jgi:integrase